MPAIDGRMDGRDVQIPTVFYRTLTPPVPSGPGGPGPLPCLQNSYHKKILKQGKGTDDHLLPLGNWLGSGLGGNWRGQSPEEYRGNLYVHLSICHFPPWDSSEAGSGF